MKSVLISIQPKWCYKIFNRIGWVGSDPLYEKRFEIRKNRPKNTEPFKCLIYCTKGKDLLISVNGIVNKPNEVEIDLTTDSEIQELNGLVIGEFICDRIVEVLQCNSGWVWENARVTKDEFFDYLGIPRGTHFGYDKKAYAWHISDLKLYDKPRELSEFKKPCNHKNDCCTCDRYDYIGHRCYDEITRPFQSWGYVYEIDT